jgi:hypothetical protein
VTVRTKILLLSSVAFLCFYVFSIAESGQSFLIANSSSDIAAAKPGSLAPIVYGLGPFLLLILSGLISWYFDYRRNRTKPQSKP